MASCMANLSLAKRSDATCCFAYVCAIALVDFLIVGSFLSLFLIRTYICGFSVVDISGFFVVDTCGLLVVADLSLTDAACNGGMSFAQLTTASSSTGDSHI